MNSLPARTAEGTRGILLFAKPLPTEQRLGHALQTVLQRRAFGVRRKFKVDLHMMAAGRVTRVYRYP
eukprot:11066481-Alexandrium_andersonii.AAC.1